jgi:nicotinate-nucleotide adenylyltransferase
MKKIAFYGGSFDPVHQGHLAIAEKLNGLFELDEFVLIPAFHAPHKTRLKPTSAYHRFAMLCLATNKQERVKVSKMELEVPARPYTVETLTRLKEELSATEIYFVMGADSWQEITTWREWERVLTMVNIIVVTRPNYEIGSSHVTDGIRERIVDLRGQDQIKIKNEELKINKDKTEIANGQLPVTSHQSPVTNHQSPRIFFTDAVQMDISATRIRKMIRADKNEGWKKSVTEEVAEHINKYDLYKDIEH